MALRPRKSAYRATGLVCVATAVLLAGLVAWGCGSDALGEARSLEAAGDLAGAAAAYQEALVEDPDDLEALLGAATNLLLLQRYDEVLPLQERIIVLDPGDAQTRVELGFNYLNHQARAADAIRVFEEAVAIDPSGKHLSFLAQAERVAGRTAEAEVHLRRAVNEDPKYPYSYRLLYSLLTGQGRVADAELVAEQASANGVAMEEVE